MFGETRIVNHQTCVFDRFCDSQGRYEATRVSGTAWIDEIAAYLIQAGMAVWKRSNSVPIGNRGKRSRSLGVSLRRVGESSPIRLHDQGKGHGAHLGQTPLDLTIEERPPLCLSMTRSGADRRFPPSPPPAPVRRLVLVHLASQLTRGGWDLTQDKTPPIVHTAVTWDTPQHTHQCDSRMSRRREGRVRQ